MKRFWNWLISPAVASAIAVLILSALVWWVAPVLGLASWGWRLGVIAALWLVWGLVVALRAWRRKRANAALLRGMSAGATAADREGQLLEQRFREAMDKLKKARRGSVFSSTSSLYDLPWYVFVGAPGSGKTTALQNAGLQFLLTDSGDSGPVKGIGGTRNCDWWFTSDAVLVDTAGRYTLQESDAVVDAKAWDNFLALLRQGRPRRPINGVLLTVNIQDLLQQNITERTQHAAKLRERLHELQTKLGVRAPVYVLVTKADLIAGFNETFDAFSQEQRDQVWGFTFAPDATGAQLMQSFDADYIALEQRLNSGLFERLQTERDGAKRAAMFAFPMEFASLRPVLGEFLGMVFASGGNLQEDARLRGVYFTSGTQEGTPIDRVMGALSRSFGLGSRATAVAGQRGKSFFLRRLLQDVVFREQHLVAYNPVAERRRNVLRGVGFALVALLSVALLAGWATSYMRNNAYAQQVVAKLPDLKTQVESLPAAQSGDVTPLPAPLMAVHQAAQSPDFDIASPPLLNALGLYQGDKLDAAAQIAYHKLLQHSLLPRVARRLEERLRSANKNNLEQAYEALKGYLMLYTPDKFDPESLKAWVSVDWDVNYARSLSPEQRKALDAHLDALLALGAPSSVAPMDKPLVDAVRDMLVVYPLEYRIYSRLKRSYRGDLPEFSVARAGGPNAAQVFERASGEPLTKGISGFYSKDGYQKTFQGSLQPVAMKLGAEESWVLGVPAKTPSLKDVAGNEVTDKVRRLYLEDYVKVWDAYLADVRLIKLTGVAASMNAARVLAAVDSPLAAYLRGIAKETTLVPPAGQASQSVVGKLAEQANKAKDDLAKLAGAQPAPDAAGGPIERIVDDHFAAMNRQVQGSPAPIDDTLKLFGEVYAQLQAVDAAQKSKAPPPPSGGADKVKAAAGTQPEPIRSMLGALADASAKGGREGEREVLTSELKPIFDFCSRAITNRYPFASGSQADVLPDDFGQLFGVGGMLDQFYQNRLANLVDTGSTPWKYKPLGDGTKPASPAALVEFQRAARIKDGFFRGGGKQPSFKLEMRAVEMDPAIKELTLDIDGQAMKFTAGNNSSVVINWPSQKVSSQVKLSGPGITPLGFEGPWALFRMFDRFDVQPSAQPEKFSMQAVLDGRKVRFEVIANSVINPFRMREIQQFRCPGAL